MSPKAQMLGAVVCSEGVTLMKPLASTSMPAALTSRAAVLGLRPAAARSCEHISDLVLPS